MRNQLEILEDIQSKGFNVVTCGDCGQVMLHDELKSFEEELTCPFCGFTRSFAAITAGEWGYAFQNSPLSFLLYAAVLLVFLWNAAALVFRVRLVRGRHLRWSRRRLGMTAVLGALLILANWLYRLGSGLK